jgi:hypothetical protein
MNASEMIILNFRIHRARKAVRSRKNIQRMQERKAAVVVIQRSVRSWHRVRAMRRMARQKVLAHKGEQAMIVQGALRMWRARSALHNVRLESSKAGLFLGRYRLSRDPPSAGGGEEGLPTVMGRPEPPGGLQGLPSVRTGATGLELKQQQQVLIDSINWRFLGEQPPPPDEERGILRLPSSSAPSRLPSSGDPHRPAPELEFQRRDKREMHPLLKRSENKVWVMWGEDEKRPPGHSLRRVMLRFTVSRERHVQQVRRLRALAGEDTEGRSWRSCRTGRNSQTST